MDGTSKSMPVNMKRVVVVLVAMTLSLSILPGFKTEARANGGAFVGGMVAGHVVGGAIRRDKERTAAQVEMAEQQRAAPAPAPAAQQTTQQKLQQLDQLAAGGYITKEEYQAKRKAILDGM